MSPQFWFEIFRAALVGLSANAAAVGVWTPKQLVTRAKDIADAAIQTIEGQ